MLRQRAGDLERHRRGETAAAQLALDQLEEVVSLLARRVDVDAAQHADGARFGDLDAREEQMQVRRNHVLEQHEAEVARVDHPRPVLRDLHAREAVTSRARVAHVQRERKAPTRDERERMRRVDDQRREHRKHGTHEVVREPRLRLGLEVVERYEANAAGGELRREGQRPAQLHLAPHLTAAFEDEAQLLDDRSVIDGAVERVALRAALQPPDPLRVKLIEVGRGDSEEADALQQRIPLVARLREHALVELEPAQLAVLVQHGIRRVEQFLDVWL
jgi:hypothetical protein